MYMKMSFVSKVFAFSSLAILLSLVESGPAFFNSMAKIESSLAYAKLMNQYSTSTITKIFVNPEEQKLAAMKKVVENNDAKELEQLLENKEFNGENVFQIFKFFSKETTLQQKTKEAYLSNMKIRSQFNENILQRLLLPSEKDLKGLAIGILWLQNVYNLSTDDLIKGNINGHPSRPLTAEEALDIVRYTKDETLPEVNMFSLHLAWLISINDSLHVRDRSNSIYIEVLKIMADIYSKTSCHCSEESFQLVQALEEIDKPYASGLKDKSLKCKKVYKRKNCPLLKPKSQSEKSKAFAHCREEFSTVDNLQNVDGNLKCTYERREILGREVPDLLLKPLKFEVLRSQSPHIAVWYNFASHKENEFILGVANNQIYRNIEDQLRPDYNQLCSNMVLNENDLKGDFMRSLQERLISNAMISPNLVKEFHSTNCGIGGTAKATGMTLDDLGRDGLDVSFILFLGDSADGTSVLFPDLGISVEATKGSLLIYDQAYEDGGQLRLTQYTACPTLHGNIWTATPVFRS